MTQQEHLLLIRAKCVELLELAKRRTPGRWQQGPDNHEGISIGGNGEHYYRLLWNSGQGPHDAAFIASAAGPFEAALASTVAAIDAVLNVAWIEHSEDRDLSWTGNKAFEAARVIIASWPLELLQQ